MYVCVCIAVKWMNSGGPREKLLETDTGQLAILRVVSIPKKRAEEGESGGQYQYDSSHTKTR